MICSLLENAAALNLRRNDVLFGVDDAGEFIPLAVTSPHDFVQRSSRMDGIAQVIRAFETPRGPSVYVGWHHGDGVCLFRFPLVIPEKLARIVTHEIIDQALQAGLQIGEVYQVDLFDDGEYGMFAEIGPQKLRTFMWEYGSCFLDDARKPSKDRAYLAVVWSRGAYLVEI